MIGQLEVTGSRQVLRGGKAIAFEGPVEGTFEISSRDCRFEGWIFSTEEIRDVVLNTEQMLGHEVQTLLIDTPNARYLFTLKSRLEDDPPSLSPIVRTFHRSPAGKLLAVTKAIGVVLLLFVLVTIVAGIVRHA